ncbi:Ig-like domain-containing protein [Pseudorhodoferax sp. Leaf267]|uniref:Ig-like domain-containing protein n=1 Tax=Pseudorhodoferax sp. Leaf267 TaxID=1736316 RepID=UPI0006F1F6C4|nr:Ig-like domain-containing protein [Pseudorhodoferax sp. Leaf267]KQP11837.1 hypothetical protein ASF43_23060 [Pseudorhodoferax sp. Leaf267]
MRRSSASSRRATNQGQQRQRARPARLLLALLARATSFICRDLLAALKNRLSTWRREIVDALTPALERMRFEPLEPRLLMSADPVSVLAPPPAADAQTAPDSHPTERRADIAMAAAPAALAAANAQASVSVTGAGTAQLTRADDGSYTLAVRGTDAASRVTLQTDGAGSHALLTALSTDSAVGALDLGLADLQGNAQLAGPVGTLVLGDLDGASIALTGTSANLRLGNVTDSSLLAGQTQLQLEADSWTGNGSLQAASLTRLAVHGSFDAALLVAPPGTAAMVLTGVNIEGSASGAWNIQGRTGNVQIGSTSPSWRAQFQAPVTQIYIVGDASGTLAAPAIQVLQVGGSMRGMSVLVGANLGADLALGGSGANADSFKAGTLARLRVIGDIVDSRVHIGVDPTTGAVLGAAGNRVQELVVVGALSGSTQLVAPAFPATVRVGGQSVAPNTLPQLQVVASDTTAPVLSAALRSDSGASASDGITNDPTLALQASDALGVTGFEARIDASGSAAYTAITPTAVTGGYTLGAAALAQLAGGTLADGAHVVELRAIDAAGNRSAVARVAFTLDTTAPAATVQLAPASDTGTVGDRQTTLASVTLRGTTGAGTRVQLGSATTTADSTGAFAFSNVALAVGSNSFSFTLTDAAGNTGTASLAVTRTAIPVDTTPPSVNTLALVSDTGSSLAVTRTAIPVDTTPPSVNTLALVSDTGSSTTDGITRDPRVQGTVSDNVAVTRLLVALDPTATPTYTDLSAALNAGAFSLSAAQLNTLAGGTLAQGAHTLSVVAVDAAGNRSTAVRRLGP